MAGLALYVSRPLLRLRRNDWIRVMAEL